MNKKKTNKREEGEGEEEEEEEISAQGQTGREVLYGQ
jgi:hypothetical protein